MLSPITLIDCNNFFVSCERLFRPDLVGRPVVVLSSNDGCVISRSEEAKALGVKMGEPYFKVKDACMKHGVTVFSSNFDLYRDLSRRVMHTLRSFSDDVEVYSVDEAFLTRTSLKAPSALSPSSCGLSPYSQYDSSPHSSAPCIWGLDRCSGGGCTKHEMCELYAWGQLIRSTVFREVGIPVSVGIAPTKTLAKAATYFAKHASRAYGNGERRSMGGEYENEATVPHTNSAYETQSHAPYTNTLCTQGVCVFMDEAARTQALNILPIEEVWGVGFRLAPKLVALGVDTAGKLAAMNDAWIHKKMSIRGLRTVEELRGKRCYKIGEDTELRKSLLHSQSFGRPVKDLPALRAAVAYHARKVAETLRAERAAARSVHVTVRTSRHGQVRYAAGDMDILPAHTNSTFELVSQALAVLTRIYRQGFPYAKAGVMVTDIVPEGAVHPVTLFGAVPGDVQPLMKAWDELRHRYGPNVVRLGVEGKQTAWAARHGLLSPRYTTDWKEIVMVQKVKS